MANDPKVIETLEALNRGYLLAGEKADVAWYDAHLALDYMATNPDGSLVDRAGFLAQIAKPCPVSGLAIEDVRIQMLGEVAIIRARTTYVKPDGQPGAGRYTDVWARRGGRWLCVAANVSRG